MMERRFKHTPYAKKSFGQNFLVDPDYIDSIISSLRLSGSDTVIEIGPGRGALTERLLERSKDVIAIELDKDMVVLLADKFAGNSNLEILHKDILQVDFTSFVSRPDTVKLVANLPYYISTAILQRLIEQRSVFSEMVLMFQREVVDRITAAPGTSDRGFLTVLVEAHLAVERLFDVPPTAFKPPPKVWSSVVRLHPKKLDVTMDEAFVSMISAGFAHKRKTILNNLKTHYPNAGVALQTAGIDPQRRAETLTADEWYELSPRLT
jgi:16S rRNA (adenine1518-N6/adenine1519-N6)-dimethyltransferase